LYRDEILSITRLAHYFGSAFSRNQVHCLLRIPAERPAFDAIVNSLIVDGHLAEKDGRLFYDDLAAETEKRRARSRAIFENQRTKLSFIVKMPWVRFAAITGANAFESCNGQADIDLFIVTAARRLWLCYLLLVITTKLLRVRPAFCINYLVDEDNQSIIHRNYFSAVQLSQMIPLTSNQLQNSLMERNRWIQNFLPNAPEHLREQDFYRLKSRPVSARRGRKRHFGRFLALCNRGVFRLYRRRLAGKLPSLMGSSVYLTEGVAKLHPNDFHNIYEMIFAEMAEVEAS